MALIKCANLYTKPPRTRVGVNFDFRTHALTVAQNVTGNLIALGIIPKGHRLIDAFLEMPDVDSGSGLVLNVGILNSNLDEADDATPALVAGKNLMSSITIGQSAGRSGLTATLNPTLDIGTDADDDRIVAVEIGTQSAGAVAGTIGLGLLTAED